MLNSPNVPSNKPLDVLIFGVIFLVDAVPLDRIRTVGVPNILHVLKHLK
jgi:hypothetical protein